MTKPLLLHLTDLYHCHNDPDDHYDLATVFALAKVGYADLAGVIVDDPPDFIAGDPAVQAVAQLNYLTGQAVPVTIEYPDERCGSRIVETMRQADRPVTISVVGGCSGIAKAVQRAPEVFREKCAGIYLNAGAGVDSPEHSAKEWNVTLDRPAYASLFREDFPCPLFWCPCFHEMTAHPETVGEYGTYWNFRQKDVFDRISPELLNYFLFMLEKSQDYRWLRYLFRTPDPELKEAFGNLLRNMWCTGGLIHSVGVAGKTYRFDPVRAKALSDDGTVVWEAAENSKQYLFHVTDPEQYPTEMLESLIALLEQL